MVRFRVMVNVRYTLRSETEGATWSQHWSQRSSVATVPLVHKLRHDMCQQKLSVTRGQLGTQLWQLMLDTCLELVRQDAAEHVVHFHGWGLCVHVNPRPVRTRYTCVQAEDVRLTSAAVAVA